MRTFKEINVPQWNRTYLGDLERKAKNAPHYLLRRGMAMVRSARSPWANVLPRETGIAIVREFGIPGTREVVELCKNILTRRVEEGYERKSGHKSYRQSIGKDEDLIGNEALLAFVLSPPILEIAMGYLREVPVLQSVELWRSVPVESSITGSQYYHQDYIDRRQVKFFVYLNDVTSQDGPLMVLPASKSAHLREKTRYKGGELHDEEVFRHVDKASEIECTGKAGDIIVADTSRCFHYGSRCYAGERWVLMFHFTSFLVGLRRKDSVPAAVPSGVEDSMRRLVLAPPEVVC
jgi:hypothetical protein